ncbi:MAG: ABC transporter ATP-binding protein [Armatimonadetes bacterium]|nr:ABC transporter ATP-binding protein [Armatimonadota bacterium]
MSYAVEMIGIGKSFGDVRALDDVTLQVQAGTLHAVVGENGAGKTTLMRALYGAMRPDQGSIVLEGKPVNFRSSREAIAAGVGMVSQHYAIIPELTCLENLILGAEGGPVLSLAAAQERAESLAQKMGFQFDWSAEASTLSPAGAQKLEILKLLWRDARIMILDEPTAMLSPADADGLFASLTELVKGGATILLVTHRLPEVMDYCQHVTTLRAGVRVDDRPTSTTTSKELARQIVGGDVIEPIPRTHEISATRCLMVNDLVVLGDRKDEALKGVSLQVSEGELVGIAGVDGSGQRELFQAIVGVRSPVKGTISIGGQRSEGATPWERIERGLRTIPEDRHEEAIIEDWSLVDNAALGLQRLAPFARGKTLDRKEMERLALMMADRFNTKRGSFEESIHSLSGGNQQRFVAGRALELSPKVLLAFQPARGLDLNATERVYAGIREACAAGAGALVVSFDLDELLSHCDRVIVMNLGRVFEPPADKALDREVIGQLMVGAG